MPGRIGRERRSEVWPGEVAGRRPQRREGRIAQRRRVVVTITAWTRTGVGFADASDRAPEVVVILRLPDGNAGIGHGHVHECQQPRQLDDVRALLGGDLHGNLVVQARWGTQARGAVIGPEDPGQGLVSAASRGRHHTVTAEPFDFLERHCILRAIEPRRRRHSELCGRLHDEWLHLAPMRSHGKRQEADGILPPLARSVAGDEINVDQWLGVLYAVIAPKRQDGGGGAAAKVNAVVPGAAMGNFGEVGGELLIKVDLAKPTPPHRTPYELYDKKHQ